MSFKIFETNSHCVGGRHGSATPKLVGDITFKCSEALFGFCSICDRIKYVTVSDKKKTAGCLGDFLKTQFKKGLNALKKMAKTVFRRPGRALEVGTNVARAIVSRGPKTVYEPCQR